MSTHPAHRTLCPALAMEALRATLRMAPLMLLMVGFGTLCFLVKAGITSASPQRSGWFPTAIGTRWTYKHFALGVGSPKREWTTIETIVGQKQIPEGLVLLRTIRRIGPPSDVTGYSGFWNSGDWLIHKGCMYSLNTTDLFGSPRGGWNPSTDELSPGYRHALQSGALHPWVWYPLVPGTVWKGSNPDLTSRVKGTANSDSFTLGFPLSRWSKGAVRIMEFNIQGPGYIWFRAGVGITDLRFKHMGSFGEYVVTLEGFNGLAAHAGNVTPPRPRAEQPPISRAGVTRPQMPQIGGGC